MKLAIAVVVLSISGTATAAPVYLECPTAQKQPPYDKMTVKLDEEHGVVDWVGGRSRASFGPNLVSWDVWIINRKTLGIQVLKRTNDGFQDVGHCTIVDTHDNKF